MAGKGLRLLNAGYNLPKPLVEVNGKTIAEWAINTIGLKGNFIFCCKNEHIEKYDLDKKLSSIVPDCKIVVINEDTEGTADTIHRASKFIDNKEDLFISDSDHCMIWNHSGFEREIRKRKLDACVMVYPDDQTSNAYSYVKLNEEGFVTEAAEKIPISNIAAAGMHYYKKGSDFVGYAKNMIKKLSVSSIFAQLLLLIFVFVWIAPTFGLFISSLRDKDVLAISGWWTSFTTTNVNEIYRTKGMEAQIEEDGYFIIKDKVFEEGSGKIISRFGITSKNIDEFEVGEIACLLYTSPSPRDGLLCRMPSSA